MSPKSIDDLNLDPDSHAEPDPRGQPWYQFATAIDELIEGGQFTWAEDSLRGIKATVEQTKQVTPGQRRAVENIEAAKGRADGWRRRSGEGFRGRWR